MGVYSTLKLTSLNHGKHLGKHLGSGDHDRRLVASYWKKL
jgi:hypothetical protein